MSWKGLYPRFLIHLASRIEIGLVDNFMYRQTDRQTSYLFYMKIDVVPLKLISNSMSRLTMYIHILYVERNLGSVFPPFQIKQANLPPPSILVDF